MIRRPPRSPLFPYTPLFRSAPDPLRSPTHRHGRAHYGPSQDPADSGQGHEQGQQPGALAAGLLTLLVTLAAVGWVLGRAIVRPPMAMSRAAQRIRGRSEERRVGEERRSRWAPDHLKKKKESMG